MCVCVCVCVCVRAYVCREGVEETCVSVGGGGEEVRGVQQMSLGNR